MSFEDNEDGFSGFLRVIPLVLILVFIAFPWLMSSPAKAPANATVFGCYAATAGPPILLDASGTHVKQPGFPTIPYHLERLKTGIALTADAPIRADKAQVGYQFGIDKRGIGRFMPFYRVDNGQAYGVIEASLLEGFQMLADDGTYINYDPAEPARCA